MLLKFVPSDYNVKLMSFEDARFSCRESVALCCSQHVGESVVVLAVDEWLIALLNSEHDHGFILVKVSFHTQGFNSQGIFAPLILFQSLRYSSM